MQLDLSHIDYTYPGAAAPALHGIDAVFPCGWTGIIGDNGCGKTTLALIAARLLKPDAGSVHPQLFSAYCPQDSTEAPPDLLDFASDWSREGRRVRDLLNIDDEWLWRYPTLSGGQQKRLQIACALRVRPDVLVLDEPTNDLDSDTRELVERALASFRGIGLLISHDRALLDALVERCLMFENGRAIMRPGGYTQVSGQATQERSTALKEREKARREADRLKAESRRRNEEAARQRSKRSRSGLDARDSDGRERIGRAIVSGKDGVAGKLATTMERRLVRAEAELDARQVAKRYEARIDDHGSMARGRYVAHVEEGAIQAGEFVLRTPELWVGPRDRVGLCGANGTGKSLLVRQLRETVPPSVRSAYVPQEVSAATRERALGLLRGHDAQQRGRILALVARLNSDPERLLDGASLSPGELRKLLLAEQLLRDPSFLVLDEPTNHLDVGSIEALQHMLVGFPGAVLLVSHDATLVEAVSTARWQTEAQDGSCRVRVI